MVENFHLVLIHLLIKHEADFQQINLKPTVKQRGRKGKTFSGVLFPTGGGDNIVNNKNEGKVFLLGR